MQHFVQFRRILLPWTQKLLWGNLKTPTFRRIRTLKFQFSNSKNTFKEALHFRASFRNISIAFFLKYYRFYLPLVANSLKISRITAYNCIFDTHLSSCCASGDQEIKFPASLRSSFQKYGKTNLTFSLRIGSCLGTTTFKGFFLLLRVKQERESLIKTKSIWVIKSL